ncbi:putative HTLV-1-related endogenous sequence [Manis pentadactyla]|uniref:putative HTLV-1-related endogenous sequence n=1 Tax=Manis pentadactyla TaxID=143292 RepID=UPI00255D002E|nr:putative HTLV-1-related endogenous sequence [Manis pentadactyla]
MDFSSNTTEAKRQQTWWPQFNYPSLPSGFPSSSSSSSRAPVPQSLPRTSPIFRQDFRGDGKELETVPPSLPTAFQTKSPASHSRPPLTRLEGHRCSHSGGGKVGTAAAPPRIPTGLSGTERRVVQTRYRRRKTALGRPATRPAPAPAPWPGPRGSLRAACPHRSRAFLPRGAETRAERPCVSGRW